MYGYYETIPELKTKDDIFSFLRSIPQLLIFEHIFKEKIDLDSLYCSPFRKDNNPKCKFDLRLGVYYFVDFTQKNPNTNCIDGIKKYYNITFIESVKLILEILNKQGITFELKKNTYSKKQKESYEIFYKVREYSNKDILFWYNKYQITVDNLKKDKVYAAEEYSYYSSKLGYRIAIVPKDITYVFTDFEKGVKIYRPLNPNNKWNTNLTNNDIGNINNLSNSYDTIIITKSYKDCRCLINLGFKNVIWFQNEGMFPSVSNLYFLNNYNKIVIIFDIDKAGLRASKTLVKYLKGFIQYPSIINYRLPKSYIKQNISDVSDMIQKKGLLKTIQIIKRLKIKLNETLYPIKRDSGLL